MSATTPAENDILTIQDAQALAEFANQHGLREDWHEPDEQNIGARIIGTHLDNAMGSSTHFEHVEHGEFNIVLTVDGGDAAVVNLATLLSWATERLR